MAVLSIKEILEGPKVSNYQNSEKTREMVASQIKKYGVKANSRITILTNRHSLLPHGFISDIDLKKEAVH